MKESKHDLIMSRLNDNKLINIRNMKVQYGLLLKESLTDVPGVLRDLDRLEGMFFAEPCESRVITKKEDALTHKCNHLLNLSASKNCRLKHCPL